MTSLFAESHNMVAILEKSEAAGEFEQIIDFLSGSYINHALTVNPHVYISCIKQFQNTAVVKHLGDVTRLQALVDKKRIVITEEVVREILQLNDAEGVICLPNDQIFVGLARMGYEKPSTKLTFYKAFFSTQWKFFIHTILDSLSAKRTSWNEFSSAMASALICLSSEQVVADAVQPPPLPYYHHLLVEGLENANAAQQLEIVKLKARVKKLEKLNKVKSSKLRRLRKVGTSQRVESLDDVENVFNQGRISVDIDQDEGIELVVDHAKDAEVQEAIEVVTTAKLITEVVTAAATQIDAAHDVSTKRRKEVVIRDPKEELHTDTLAETPTVKDKGKGILIEDPKPIKKKDQVEMDVEYAKKLQEELDKEHEEAYKQIDWNVALDHVQSKEPQYIKRYHGIKKKPQSKSEAHKNMISYLKNTEGYKMEFFKGKTYDQILLIFQAKFDANMKFLFKSREEMEKKDEEIIKSINKTPTQKATKRRKLSEEAQEADDLKKRLEIIQDEDDDVFVEDTPLAQKIPVVDYQIVVIDNKPKYKIIRADDTHQFYISFTTLLKNFDREDLETL
nr:hypothetical protein [Tanacetum cinerariifolium]